MSDFPTTKEEKTNNKKFSEEALEEIVKIRDNLKIELFEAAVIFCENNDLDPEEFVKKLPSSTIAQIKRSAIIGSYIRKKFYEITPELPI